MIKYDYQIIRQEGNVENTYTPTEFPKEIPLLSIIEGPNSSGKSTLLNIIALAFGGNKNDELSTSLREQVDYLLNSGHQTLKFNLEINNPIMDIKIVIEKRKHGSPAIVIKEILGSTESIISADTLSKDYKLIYDLPYSSQYSKRL